VFSRATGGDLDTPTGSNAPRIAARETAPSAGRSAVLERVGNEWLAQLRAALAPLDLTHAQCRLLLAAAWLGSRVQGVRQSDIAAEAGMDPVMTSEVLRTLESRQLIARAPHPTDGRAKSISVTETGGALADRALRLVEAAEEAFFAAGMTQFGTLAKSLKKGGRGAGDR
jgi:MarR family transcriptional regulator, organic hydroperoxide resistance regulator